MLHITSRLREEREAAIARSQKIQERDLRFILESRVSELNEKLAQAQKQLDEQQEVAKGLIRQMVMERDESRSQLSEAEARAQKLQETLNQEKQQAARATSLEQELATIRQALSQEKKAAEFLAHQLKAERDESRTQLSSFESHLKNLEEQLSLAQKQFQDQRETVIRLLQKRAADRD